VKLAFFVSSIGTEKPEYTTTRLARAAVKLGHEVFYVAAGGFCHGPEDAMGTVARPAPSDASLDLEDFCDQMQEAEPVYLDMTELGAVMLRNDPSEDIEDRPWAVDVGIVFGQLAMSHGVTVVNDPLWLSKAANKLYMEEFPSEVRPKTLVARDIDAIKRFVEGLNGKAVLKPLLGAKGQSVFFVQGPDDPNLNQIIDTIRSDGYVVAQEFLEGAEDGDVRFFMLNGEPLRSNGSFAAFRRRPAEGDLRSNISAGGKSEAVDIGEDELKVARTIGPKLAADGMFLAGLDIVGDKLVEVNVQSPGGLGSIEAFTGIDFAPIVIEALVKRAEAV
jgi:glutathione synthase